MLRPKKKISRKELKEDTLITWYVKARTLYDANKRTVSIALTVIVVAVGALLMYLKNRADNNENAITALGAIFETYDAGQYQTAIDGIPERNIKGLRSIVDNYGNSPTGDLARLYLANACYHLGRYDEALKAYGDFSPSGELLTVARFSGLGATEEAKGEYREAAAQFEKAATRYPADVDAAEYMSDAARDYARAGEKEKAIDLYRRIKKNYPTSPFARDADRFIAQLSV
ncbi:MAG TPA: tetratricopeptide repeat protein [Bacteroidota bacterium]|nr:tetratricopeptide repeat protein [Bacteroidota bacterium]